MPKLIVAVILQFLPQVCDENKIEKLEMDTDVLYLAFAEYNLDDCKLSEKKAQWTQIRRHTYRDDFIADEKKK